MWCIAAITAQYRERMYKLLDLYAEDYDESFPVICVDEKSKQLIEDVRNIIPLKPGSLTKYDYEYKRNGTRNIFVAIEPLAGKRKIQVTCRRQKNDFAYFIKELLDKDYKKVKIIRLVLLII